MAGLCLGLLLSGQIFAILDVVVVKGAKNTIPVTVLPFFINKSTQKSGIANTISQDLSRSGYFNTSIVQAIATPDQVDYQKWQSLKTEILVFGDIKDTGGEFFTVSVYVYEVFSQQSILAYRYNTNKNSTRKTAHQISDKIYQVVLGFRGDFDTYLTYIQVTRNNWGIPTYHLKVSESDGENSQTLFSSSEPLLSPAWSPDNQKIAYVSFENGHSEVFVRYPFSQQNIITLPKFNGIASAPSWHPNGEELALTLSKNGNKDIYRYHLKTKKLSRLTSNNAIETEGNFSPDGQQLVFTSNRGGNAQIYLKNLSNNRNKRLSYTSGSNTSARFSPEGDYLIMLNANKGKFQILLLEISSREQTIMSQNILDETPVFSPNGKMVIFSSNVLEKGVLSMMTIDGSHLHYLSSKLGDIKDPSWSNFLTNP